MKSKTLLTMNGNGLEQELKKQAQFLEELGKPVEINRSVARVLNDVASSLRTKVVRGTSKKMDIQQKLLRKRIFLRRASSRFLMSQVKSYTNGFSIMTLNRKASVRMHLEARNFRQRGRRGSTNEIRYRKYQWDNAFSQRVNGKNVILQRKKNSRYPVDVPRVEIGFAVRSISYKLGNQIQNDMGVRLNKEMHFRIKKAMGKL